MLPEATSLPRGAPPLPDAAVIHEAVPEPWRLALGKLALTWLALLGLFLSDWVAMAGQWWNSSTYNHILLVPAIVGWLAWVRVPQLARLEPQAWLGGVGLFAAAAFLWVLGSMADLSIARQAGAVGMLIASVPALLGPKVAVGLLFPLAYMAFLVPFGDELIPALQLITAKITLALTNLSGITARADGTFIETPAGLFVVAEACSGVKFVVAMAAFAALTANVGFRSWPKRIVFFAGSLVVAVLANGVRAWGTVYVAQTVGAERASGIDHIIYGWFFFAAVIAAVLTLAWRHFDRSIDDPMIDAGRIGASPLLTRWAKRRSSPGVVIGAMTAIAAAVMLWSSAAAALTAKLPERIELPPVPGWHRIAYAPRMPWEPRAAGADHRLIGRYAAADGRQVDVFYALYAAQGQGREAGGFGEGAVIEGSWAWVAPGPEAGVAKSERIIAGGTDERVAETYYRTGDLLTGSNTRLKLANIRDRLLLRRRPTMLLILSAEQPADGSGETALAEFRRAVGPLGAWMDRIAATR